MTDLERFFRHLVATLAAADPARLEAPLSIAELQQSILPYRTHRRALGVASSEDYEVLVLRLSAGEGGFARTEPAEIQARFKLELTGSNPDLALLERHGDALVSLSVAAIRGALSADPHAAYAPPAPVQERTHAPAHAHAPPVHIPSPVDPGLEDEREPELDIAEPLPLDAVLTPAAAAPAPETPDSDAPMCLYCGATLPGGRQVNFCPQCGQNQAGLHCPSCQGEIELGWRHCIVCGAAVGEGGTSK
ncbi:MAG TPA: zinc ribbon domain-containing protein [Gemmatimonadales bacterium]|nr:zinc ribbon domain-containing protein [Gemmatimonadales bacterium]